MERLQYFTNDRTYATDPLARRSTARRQRNNDRRRRIGKRTADSWQIDDLIILLS